MVNGFNLAELTEQVAEHGAVVRVLITGFQGSTPRETGASMTVWATGQSGTIGGGALEWEAARQARKLLDKSGDWQRGVLKMPLGPALGQCCGGTVSLLMERFSAREITEISAVAPTFTRPKADGISPAPAPLQAARLLRIKRSGAGDSNVDNGNGWISEAICQPLTPLWLYGAGHVGREIVRVLTGLPFSITWIDTSRARFPAEISDDVDWLTSQNPAALVSVAPKDALHFVLTYSHAHDLEICHQVLSRDFGHLGLIGSASKKARFLKRLRELGHSDTVLARLECPIGDRSLGKTPQAIAIGLAYSLMQSNIVSGRVTSTRVNA
ncbi:MAG: xanthine dehydrogenase accessory protein XdhC [Rhodobacteraceae bacterium]|nr:xanthine dehydrogenase accessory protein XdhC [Paracoccaceae bacterium]